MQNNSNSDNSRFAGILLSYIIVQLGVSREEIEKKIDILYHYLNDE